MKIVQIIGGLGNQMWQYAMLVALRKACADENVYYNASFFNGYPLHNGFELERIFNISAKQASNKDIRKVYHYFVNHYFFLRLYRHYFSQLDTEIREIESNPYQESLLRIKGNFYYNGYWADHRYYDWCRAELLNEFTLKEPLDDKNNVILNELKSKYTCSIHVRRGDYLKNPNFCGICDLDYYKRAVGVILSKTESPVIFLVFSNDISYCKENMSNDFGENEVIYVDWNTGKDSYKDMYMMSQCNANIIANSSFSWWGAYLNERPNKIIISPIKYKNVDMGFKVALDDWICL